MNGITYPGGSYPGGQGLLSGTTFAPSDIPGLQGWYDFSQLTGLSANDPISLLPDLSGNVRDVAQATLGKRPLWIPNAQNGLAVGRFDGVDDELALLTTLGCTTDLTVALVYKQPSSSSHGCAFRLGDYLTGVGYGTGIGAGSGTMDSNGGNLIGLREHIGWDNTATPLTHTDADQITWLWQSGAVDVARLNGTQVYSGGAANFGNIATTGTGGGPLFTLGNDPANAGRFWPGDIHEVLVWNRQLTATEYAQVETYLHAKWFSSGAVPAGAIAGGTSPVVQVPVLAGGAAAGGAVLGIRVAVNAGGAGAGGAGPVARVLASPGGAVAGGVNPSAGLPNQVSPGGASAGGVGPTARVPSVIGGAGAGGINPSAGLTAQVSAGGALAGGVSPSQNIAGGPASPIVSTAGVGGPVLPWGGLSTRIARAGRQRSVFRLVLIRSRDMVEIDDIKNATSRLLQVTLDKSGSLSFGLTLEDEITEMIQEVETGVKILRNEQNVWSGPVWTVEEQTPNTVNIGCVGWGQTLEKRFTKPSWGTPLKYTDVDAGLIAQYLLTRSNSDAGGSSAPVYVVPGNTELTQSRTREYVPYSPILGSIDELSSIESGFDYTIHPQYRTLDIVSKLEVIRNDLIFEYRDNVKDANRKSDSSKICNRMIAYSSIGSAQEDDLESQDRYGLFEEAVALADVKDMSILKAYAAAEVAIRSKPLRLTSFVPRPFSDSNPADPRLFEDFNIGDIGYLTVKKGRFDVRRQAVRIFGAALAIADNGDEAITSIATEAS